MATTAVEHAPAHAEEATGLWSWITTVDHKRIGILYGATAFLFFLMGGIEALIIRLQLSGPEQDAGRVRTSTTSCSRCTAPP